MGNQYHLSSKRENNVKVKLQILAITTCLINSIVAASEPTISSVGNFIAQDNEIIISIKLRNEVTLSDATIAYIVDESISIPLEQAMLMLEFPIQTTAQGASGWFIKENRTFSLDKKVGKVISEGKTFTFQPSKLKSIDGELYVPIKLLSTWLPIDIKGNLRTLSLNITPRESIPVDSLNQRLGRKFGSATTYKALNPKHDTPYQLFGIPSLDVDLNVGQLNNMQGSYAIRGYTDLVYMGSEFTFLGNQDELADARLSLSRKNPRGSLLGSLDATLFELGDISSRSVPLISNATGGRGIHIERRPAGYVGSQETVTLEGLLESGYDVELYRNDILIDAIRSGSASEYNFKDIRLFGGQNELRLEFHGPQGQQRTETKRYFMGAGKLKKGEVQYDIALSQPGQTTLDIKETGNTEDALAGTFLIGLGLNSHTSISSGFSKAALDSIQSREYIFAGVDTQINGYLLSSDIAIDDEGESAFSFGATTSLKNTNLSGNLEVFSDEFSLNSIATEDDSNSSGLSSRFSLGVDHYSDGWINNLHINSGLEFSTLSYLDGESRYSLDGRISAGFRNMQVNQKFTALLL